MALIKILLIASAVVLLVILFRHRDAVFVRAGSRVVALTLFAVAVAAIADPRIPQSAADALGVGRGTDLVLYLLVVVFALTSMGLYFRIRQTENRIRKLARSLAISEAIRREDSGGSLTSSGD